MSNIISTDIILSSGLQDFTTSEELKKCLILFKRKCEEHGQIRTLPGLCRALNISKEEYLQFRNGEYKKELEQVELSIKHECINKGIKFAGAWKYLENEFPDDYRKDPNIAPPNVNMIIVGMQIINESNALEIQK